MASTEGTMEEQIHNTLNELKEHVRETSKVGAKPIPNPPISFNLLARPHPQSALCRICNLPGHHSPSAQVSAACRTALLSLITFWDSLIPRIMFLKDHYDPFRIALHDNVPTYKMRLPSQSPQQGAMETVLVDGLTRMWLRFSALVVRLGLKIEAVLEIGDKHALAKIRGVLNEILLHSLTIHDLYKREVEASEKAKAEKMEAMAKELEKEVGRMRGDANDVEMQDVEMTG